MKNLAYVLLVLAVAACRPGVKQDTQSEATPAQVQEPAQDGISLFDEKRWLAGKLPVLAPKARSRFPKEISYLHLAMVVPGLPGQKIFPGIITR